MPNSYEPASICLKGHVIDRSHAVHNEHCPKCGVMVLSSCNHCQAPFRGEPIFDMVTLGSFFKFPYYCYKCGHPYPWTQLILDNAFELLSLDDTLSDETKMIIKNAIPDLIVESATTPLAVAKYRKHLSGAEQFVKDGLKQLLISVVTETVKNQLF